ncbi:MAG: metallophosphoesterase [Candidatus Woesearchaeota archaeon]
MDPELIKRLLEKNILVSPDTTDEEARRLLGDAPETKLVINPNEAPELNIVYDFNEPPKKRTVQDFVGLFNARFRELEGILRNRVELQNLTSISRAKKMQARERTAIIGMVLDKRETKNHNIILVMEDQTGSITTIFTQKNKETFEMVKDIMLDEVIGITGQTAGDAIFADKIILPDVPVTKELRKAQEDEYLVVLGDPHIGSKRFLRHSFGKFLQWINAEAGTPEQRDNAKKVKHIIVTGDLVEGVGIYPNQERDLEIPDIRAQYEALTSIISQIPQRIRITMFTGNHDSGRMAEPQPALGDYYSETLHKLPNVTFVSNPSVVNIGRTDKFEGFDLLLYHGYSLGYYGTNIPSVRAAGGMTRADLIMKYFLQRRHLAPSHKSTLYVPTPQKDPLVISTIPDFFITGHTHCVTVTNYRNITLINGSCWAGMSEDQEKRGITPAPARIILVNLKTRAVKIMNFMDKTDIEEGRSLELVA